MDEDEVADAISSLESQLADFQQALFPYDTGYAVRDAFDGVRAALRRHKEEIMSLTARVAALESGDG